MSKKLSLKVWPWLIVMSAMLFYAYNYLLRTSPSTMMGGLTHHFGISAAAFGSLAACFYYVYTPMQIPVGLIMDRYRMKVVMIVASIVAVFGLFLFDIANAYWVACVGRLLIGFGCAFAYLGVVKLATQWLPVNRFATAAGLTTAFGMLAGAGSDIYLTKAVSAIGYRDSLHGILILGVVLVVVLIFMLRENKVHLAENKHKQDQVTFKSLALGLKAMCLSKQMWVIGIIACLAYLPASVFLDVWGIPYLTTARHLSATDAGYLVSFMFVGWIVSAPLIGGLSDAISRRRLPLSLSAIGMCLVTILLLYVPHLGFTGIAVLLFLFGFFAGAQPLVFSLSRENNPDHFAATAMAFTNMLTMVGGAVFQPIVGKLLDWHAGGIIHGSTIHLSASDYRFALSVFPISALITLGLTFMLRETKCELYEEPEVLTTEEITQAQAA